MGHTAANYLQLFNVQESHEDLNWPITDALLTILFTHALSIIQRQSNNVQQITMIAQALYLCIKLIMSSGLGIPRRL